MASKCRAIQSALDHSMSPWIAVTHGPHLTRHGLRRELHRAQDLPRAPEQVPGALEPAVGRHGHAVLLHGGSVRRCQKPDPSLPRCLMPMWPIVCVRRRSSRGGRTGRHRGDSCTSPASELLCPAFPSCCVIDEIQFALPPEHSINGSCSMWSETHGILLRAL